MSPRFEGRVMSRKFVPISFVADAETRTGRHTLGVGLKMMGRRRIPIFVALYLPVKFVGNPVASVILTSKYSTENPLSTKTLKNKLELLELFSKVT
jgi:hypothetical protein